MTPGPLKCAFSLVLQAAVNRRPLGLLSPALREAFKAAIELKLKCFRQVQFSLGADAVGDLEPSKITRTAHGRRAYAGGER